MTGEAWPSDLGRLGHRSPVEALTAAHAVMIATSPNPYSAASRLGYGTPTVADVCAIEDWFHFHWLDRLEGNPEIGEALRSGDADAVERVLDDCGPFVPPPVTRLKRRRLP